MVDAQPNFHGESRVDTTKVDSRSRADFHHENFVGNYGLLGVLDRLHGTDKAWRERQAKAR